ncbi:MAG: sigma-70 family RNA polymerase sigma factor [Clostridia bacterium]|nr:sigma-70 family RNA polymerase sigma factor [Clostridia bacterium]
MQDQSIIDLYFSRSEQAVRETEQKYGAYCTAVAMNILHNEQDAEEIVNDTWLWLWQHIPPDCPPSVRRYIARVARNLSISRWRYLHADKRDRSLEVVLEEADECCPGLVTHPENADLLRDSLNDFLRSLKEKDRSMFILRYYHTESVTDIATGLHMKPAAVSRRLEFLRDKLRRYLAERGYTV